MVEQENKIRKKKLFFEKIDKHFLLIFIIGAAFRILSFIFVDTADDTFDYLDGALGIITLNYQNHRPPAFPLIIIPFLLIFGYSGLAVKAASLTCGIILIPVCYFIFSKMAMRIFKDKDSKEKMAKAVALITTLSVSIHNNLVYNNGRGLREEYMSILLVLLFYYIFIEGEKELRNDIIAGVLMALFSVVHVTAHLTTYAAILVFFLLPKLKFLGLKYKFSLRRFLIITIAIIGAYGSWVIYCYFNFGDPFYTITHASAYIDENTGVSLGSLTEILGTIESGLRTGIINIVWLFILILGPTFLLILVISSIKFYRDKQIFFLIILLVIYFLFISGMMTRGNGDFRYLMYFVPFLYYIESLLIIELWFDNKDTEIFSIQFFRKRFGFNTNQFLIGYIITYIVRSSFYLINICLTGQGFKDGNIPLSVVIFYLGYALFAVQEILLVAPLLNVDLDVRYLKNKEIRINESAIELKEEIPND